MIATAMTAPIPTAAPTTSPVDGPMLPVLPVQATGAVEPEPRRTARTVKAAMPSRRFAIKDVFAVSDGSRPGRTVFIVDLNSWNEPCCREAQREERPPL